MMEHRNGREAIRDVFRTEAGTSWKTNHRVADEQQRLVMWSWRLKEWRQEPAEFFADVKPTLCEA